MTTEARRGREAGHCHNGDMKRFGLTNFYLQAGVLLILLGMLCYALPFVVPMAPDTLRLMGNVMPIVLVAGIVVYLIGRVVAMRNRSGG